MPLPNYFLKTQWIIYYVNYPIEQALLIVPLLHTVLLNWEHVSPATSIKSCLDPIIYPSTSPLVSFLDLEPFLQLDLKWLGLATVVAEAAELGADEALDALDAQSEACNNKEFSYSNMACEYTFAAAWGVCVLGGLGDGKHHIVTEGLAFGPERNGKSILE